MAVVSKVIWSHKKITEDLSMKGNDDWKLGRCGRNAVISNCGFRTTVWWKNIKFTINSALV